ncbi:MAG TPA: amidohydrolase family protein [Acidimicrobiia bacterium]|nr:amidohydrolase family protein [Acidimicrobiia bacterium]
MTATQSSEQSANALPYPINDADEHSTPARGAYEKYIDPDKRDMAIRYVTTDSGFPQALYNGRPARFTFKNFQVVGSNDQLAEVGVSDAGGSEEMGGAPVPGSLLTRLNPLKDLDAEGRKEFARKYRAMQEQLDNPADRLTVMDSQGIGAAVNFATLPGTEVEFEDDYDGLYANLTALNRYLGNEWGFNYENRLFTPPFVSFADPDAALAQLDDIMKIEVPKVIQTSQGPSMHTSPFRPENDRFWDICSEAGIKLTTHLATVTRYGAQGLDWSEEEVMLGDMNAFQWVFYYGDRPAMETAGAAILQGWFARFPKMQLLLSEQGTVWVPYTVRKLDHSFLMGRRASFGRKLERRPSEYFKDHVFVAPFPEENVDRIVEAVGTKPIVFGSDFPHGEGLPEPSMYLGQLKNLDETQTKEIMSDNLARFLDLPTA